MTRTHQLEHTLRTLKLGGMLATLEQRLAQARAGELGHLEFLQVLCEDEINRRQAKALRERVRRTRFEQPTTLEDFDFHFNPKLPIAQLRDLATCQFVELGESVILYGPAGRQRPGLTRFYRHVFNVAKKLWRSPGRLQRPGGDTGGVLAAAVSP